jgi:hypothetical protein
MFVGLIALVLICGVKGDAGGNPNGGVGNGGGNGGSKGGGGNGKDFKDDSEQQAVVQDSEQQAVVQTPQSPTTLIIKPTPVIIPAAKVIPDIPAQTPSVNPDPQTNSQTTEQNNSQTTEQNQNAEKAAEKVDKELAQQASILSQKETTQIDTTIPNPLNVEIANQLKPDTQPSPVEPATNRNVIIINTVFKDLINIIIKLLIEASNSASKTLNDQNNLVISTPIILPLNEEGSDNVNLAIILPLIFISIILLLIAINIMVRRRRRTANKLIDIENESFSFDESFVSHNSMLRTPPIRNEPVVKDDCESYFFGSVGTNKTLLKTPSNSRPQSIFNHISKNMLLKLKIPRKPAKSRTPSMFKRTSDINKLRKPDIITRKPVRNRTSSRFSKTLKRNLSKFKTKSIIVPKAVLKIYDRELIRLKA